MAEISRSDMFAKLTPIAYKSLESATMFCKLRGHSYIEISHWLFQILQSQDSDIHHILRAFEINSSRLAADLTAALDQLPRGATSISDLSSHVEEAVERSWLYASLLFRSNRVRSGYLLVGMLKTPALRNQLLGLSSEFGRIKIERLTDDYSEIVKGSPEESESQPLSDSNASSTDAPASMGGSAGLDRFTTDITAAARKREIDPVVGRSPEIRRVIDILMRRRQNNPILTGEAGVGKTAVVEGLALRIAAGDVPPSLANVRLLALDVGLLQAGASMKGEFEQRLRQVVDEVQSSTQPTILFIDEAHTLLGSASGGNSGDAANLLKPALARGTLRTIAATTWSEYKKYIEKDPALTRRFQVVKVDQPDTSGAVRMLRHLTTILQEHHGVRVLDEAVVAAVELSSRYVPDRQLPDKAVSLLDTAAARVAVSQHSVPAQVDDVRKLLESLELEAEIIRREAIADAERAEELAPVENTIAEQRQYLSTLESRWEQERQVVQSLLELHEEMNEAVGQEAAPAAHQTAANTERSSAGTSSESTGFIGNSSALLNHVEADNEWGTQIDTFPVYEELPDTSPVANVENPKADDCTRVQDRLTQLQKELRELQGDEPLVLATVDYQAVAAVVADWTGIPVGRMMSSQIESVLQLDETLGKRVVGQDHAMETIARRIQTSRAGLDDPEKPVGVFLLAGPSGVGKTETAITLAEELFGGQQNLITINMSEFQEAHTVSTLKGAPPGYVGYGEGGVLTEAVRRKPYSVVLLDEVEKAHPDTHEIFFQVFDKGRMDDGEGRTIDFKNTLILLTSNVGSEVIMQLTDYGRVRPPVDELTSKIRPHLVNVFPPALLGRMVVVPFYPLDDTNLGRIIELKLGRIVKRVRQAYDAELTYSPEVISLISRRCTEVESGGRMIDAILTNTVLPEISRRVLQLVSRQQTVRSVALSVSSEQLTYDVIARELRSA